MPHSPHDDVAGPRGNEFTRRWVSGVLLLAAIGYLVWPLHHATRTWSDFAFVYTAGKSWLHGLSPYDIPRWREEWSAVRPIFWDAADGIAPAQPFFYPPHWIVLSSALALLPWGAANRLWDCVNVLTFFGLCVFSVRLSAAWSSRARHSALFVCLSLACLSGAVRYSFYNSQMSLLPTCAVVAAFWCAREGRTAWLSLCVFVALLKPQIALLPMTYLLLGGAASGVLLGGACALALSLVTILRVGPGLILSQWGECYAGHMHLAFNDLSHFSSLSSLFGSSRWGALAKSLSPLAGLCAILLLSIWRKRSSEWQNRGPLWEVSLCLALTAAFIPLHDYDLGLYTPLFVLLAEVRPRSLAATLAACAFLAGRVPALEAWTHLRPLAPWFTLVIWVLLVLSVVRRSRKSIGKSSPFENQATGAR